VPAMRKSLLGWFTLTALVALAALAVLLVTSDSVDRDELRSESAKGLIQVVLVVLLGAALKLLVDRYQDQ
jgi:heme A synthase